MTSTRNDSPTKEGYGAISQPNGNDENNVRLSSVDSSSEHNNNNNNSHSLLGIAWIMVGSFSFSVMFLLVKLMEGKANSFTLVFYRSLVQIVLSLSNIARNGENPFGQVGNGNRIWLLVRGGFGSGAVIAWFYGIQHLPLPDAVTLQFTTPVFAALFAVCFVGEVWKRLDMVGAVVCLMGVCLIAHPTWLFGSVTEQSTVNNDDVTNDPTLFLSTNYTILLSNTTTTTTTTTDAATSQKGMAVVVTTAGAAMAGLAYVSVRLITGTSANVMVLYYATLSIPIVLLGSYGLLDTWTVWAPNPGSTFSMVDYLLLLLTGLAGYGGQFFTNLGLQRETAATGTLATSTQIVWTYVFELVFLHEGINGWSLAGTGLILGFMMIVGITKVAEHNNNNNKGTMNVEESDRLLAAQLDEL
ncbi:EamA-like transporter family protein [Nitzschia inconspicua]|uniref:EamA-like transporter family protein n=1 Tax=Nitzschia inconspicua TaxID=303405 RepID=A0A9K3KX18_9STRA|nr:EamA-like transporter family protein [Nitzschia inconspicua]